MKNIYKVLILLFLALYAFSPIDCYPGPIDDFIVIVAGIIAQSRIKGNSKTDNNKNEPRE